MKTRFFGFLIPIGLFAFCAASPADAIETAFEHDSSLPIVYLNVAVKTGSVSDPRGLSGLTNFMGEMLLRGTTTRPKEQIDVALDQMGARLEVETRHEALILRGAVLSSQLEPFLALVADVLTHPAFSDGEIRRLKPQLVSNVLEELGDDAALVNRAFEKFLFRDHPYGRPVMGERADLRKITRAELARHYDRIVRDGLLLVVGEGDADEGRIERWAEALAKARPGEGDRALVAPPEDAPTRRLLIVDKPARTQTQIDAGQVGVRMTDPDFFSLYLGNYAFGGPSFSARLMSEIRVKRGWSYGAGSAFRFGLQPHSWHMHLFPASKDTPAALAYSLKMLEDAKTRGITQAEFDFAKRSLVNNAGFAYNTPKKRVDNTLLERTLDLPRGMMRSYGPHLAKVTLGEVNAALKRFLSPDRVAITVVGTAKDLKANLTKAAGVPPSQVEVIPYDRE